MNSHRLVSLVRWRRRTGGIAAVFLVALATVVVVPKAPAPAATLPAGFHDVVTLSGLELPTTVRFAPDGRIFVAEKSGLIKAFDNLSDTSATIVADLRTNVYNMLDRGLLGMVLDPNFATKPYVYVLYTHDARIGGTAPLWGQPGATWDGCPDPPGSNTNGCVASGRLSRLQVGPNNVMTGSEQVLIEDWCQQFPSHSVGDLAFGADGALYVSGGDAASWEFVDYGQTGSPRNPCGDPPGAPGTVLTPPTAEGGALRSQDLRTSGDPVTLDGAVLRVNPDTGAALPDNPLAAHADPNARRIISYGLRNPFRITTRPGTNELWVGDVGWSNWEEIDVINDVKDAAVENFGWPCYEGPSRQPGYDGANLNICENLYAQQAATTPPYFNYHHNSSVVPGDTCPIGGSSTTGVSFRFYEGGSYPPEYDGALFFADYSRNCIWVMLKGTNGRPDTTARRLFVGGAASPVDLEVGPGGDLFYVDIQGGAIRRIQYGAPPPPIPSGTHYLSDLTWSSATNGWGPVERDMSNGEQALGDGRTITLNGTTYAKGLGAHADSDIRFNLGGACSSFTADVGVDDETWGGDLGSVVFQVWADATKLYDSGRMTGLSATKKVDVSVSNKQVLRLVVTDGGDNLNYDHADWAGARVSCGTNNTTPNAPPTVDIAQPAPTFTWKVGDTIAFSGSANDPEDGALPASALSWDILLQHCPSTCHAHPMQGFSGVASGSFPAPDHGYPAHIDIVLKATDSGGAIGTKAVSVHPQTVPLTFASDPSGLELVVGPTPAQAPFDRTVIVGSANSVSAPGPQTLGGVSYDFVSWSDGGGQSHNIVAPAAATTYTATFTPGADAAPPQISAVQVSNVTTSSATIRWTTDEPADSQVQYGRQTTYGSSTPLDPALVTTHSQTITGLKANTPYHFRVRGSDAAGNLALSADFTFKTQRR